jgi:nucleotide-binding universal stress UspA family protein
MRFWAAAASEKNLRGGIMTIEKKLLILVDGSERSIQTVNYIKDFMPVDEHTQIVLFHVLSGIPEEYRQLLKDPTCVNALQDLKNRETEEKAQSLAYLERAKEILITSGIPEQSVELKLQAVGKGIARDIIDEARNGYTAVLMSRRGITMALQNIILGSVAVKLLQSLVFIPIIMVGKEPPVKKLLLAVDASPNSMKAVEFVGWLLGGHGYEVCIFHAIIGLGKINFELSGCEMPELSESQMSGSCVDAFKLKTARLFQDIREKLQASGFEPDKISEKIVSGVHSRSEAIVREAEAGSYSTIVVGRRGLSRVEAFFMGRVGHKVIYEGKKFTVWVV